MLNRTIKWKSGYLSVPAFIATRKPEPTFRAPKQQFTPIEQLFAELDRLVSAK
jgi:hypothetical protein